MKRAWTVLVVLAFGAAAVASTQFENPGSAIEAKKAAVKQDVRAWDEQNALKFGNDQQFIIKPAMVVDKKARTVTLRGYATGLGNPDPDSGGAGGGGSGRPSDPVEFFLIGEASGKGYEALAVSLAKPSDIHAGLEAIGLPAGRPVNWARMQLWPKGERVKMTFRWKETNPDGTVSDRSARAEEMLVDRRTGKPLPLTGLVFVGGLWLPPEKEGEAVGGGGGGGGGQKRYYADLGDPGSIASNYNEGTTVLDMPVQARQSEVYQSRIVNPAHRLKAGQAIEVLLEPEYPQGLRVADVIVKASGKGELRDVKYEVNGQTLDTTKLIETFQKLLGSGKEAFVTVNPDDEMPLQGVKRLYGLMRAIEGEKGIRLEPPAKGHLFHEAFDPDENLRDYRKRTWQPVEIRIAASGVVTLRDYRDDAGELKFDDTAVESPEKLAELLKARSDQRRPIAVFAPAQLEYGKMMHWLRPGLTEEMVVWVYLE